MRKQPLVTGEYYHIYNRGVDKRDIYNNKKDLERFVESMREFNALEGIDSLSNARKTQIEAKPLSEPLVAIVAYCLNPNHFHFVLRQIVDGGISEFMRRLQGGYTYYFNVKYARSGSLFQGTFKSQHMGTENYFNKILGYTNKNYQVHAIPKNRMDLVVASDIEYENNNFNLVSKMEGKKVLEIFNGSKNFKRHSDDIVSIVRQERGKTSLLEEESLPC